MSTDPQGEERKNLYTFAGRSLDKSGAEKVLDIACGDGEGSAILARDLAGARIFGIDLDEKLIRSAKLNHAFGNLNYMAADARRIPFPGEEFGAVVSFHTLEHFDAADQRQFLSELNRVLKSSGVLLIATPDREVWEKQGIANTQSDHIRELSQDEFVDLLRGTGFRVEGVFGQSMLKGKTSGLRSVMNFLKKMDVLRLRRVLGRKLIDKIDEGTQPVMLDTTVLPLQSGERASVTVLACRKI